MSVEDLEAVACDDADGLRDRKGIIVTRRVGYAAEGNAVTTGQAVRCCRRGSIMLMRDMRNRIQREGEQQACERNSQPVWWSSGQMEDGHE